MLSGLSLGDHLNKAANNQPPYNKQHTTLESVTDTEPTILEEDEQSIEFGGNASFDGSFAAVSLEGDTSLPSSQAAPTMSNNSIRSLRSTRSNASNTTTRSSGNRSTRQLRIQQQRQEQQHAFHEGHASSSNMVAPKSPFSSLKRSNTGTHLGRPHSPNSHARHVHHTHCSERHVPFGRVRESSERSPEQKKSRNRDKMRRSKSLNNREHNNEEADGSRITRFMNRTREPPKRDFLEREPSLKFSNHSRLGTVGHNMHSSFMFSGDSLDDLDGSLRANNDSGMMDRIGESNESDDAGDMSMQDLSFVNMDERRRSSSKPKPKEDALRMASLLRFGSNFFNSTAEEPEEQQQRDSPKEVDAFQVYWTRNAENMPVNRSEFNYLPSPKPSTPRSKVGVMKEIVQDSTFAQNISFLQDQAHAVTKSWGKDVNAMVEENKNFVEERTNLWQRNMFTIGKDVNAIVEENKNYVEERTNLWQRNMSTIGAWIRDAPL